MKNKIKLNYEIKDYDVYDTHKDHAIVRAKIVNVGKNYNDTSFSKESIEKAIPTLYNIPLIGIYSEIENDFKSHAKNALERKQTYAIGTIPESCNAHFEKELGMEYLVADIVVWKEYFPEFFNVIENNEEKERQTTISMEISLSDYEKKDGIFDIKEFSFNGICLLGENVKPGIPNAGLRVIRFEEGKIDFEDNSLYQNLLKESNEELEILSKYCEKTLSIDNGKINKNLKKGEVGNMAEEKETLAENFEKVKPTEKGKEATEKGVSKKEKETTEDGVTEKKDAKKKPEDMTKMEDKEKSCSAKMEDGCEPEEHPEGHPEGHPEEKHPEEHMEKEAKCEKEECEEKEAKCEKETKCEENCEDKPLSRAERKTYQANEKAYQEKIAYLKGELAAYKPYKAMYKQAEKEIKELLEYKEEAELNKLEREKSEYFKSFGATQFDDDDKDEIIKKINDYNFSYQDFKAFMADKVQKYGMKTRFQNITEVINMYSEAQDVASKYAESEVSSDEDKVLDKYTKI